MQINTKLTSCEHKRRFTCFEHSAIGYSASSVDWLTFPHTQFQPMDYNSSLKQKGLWFECCRKEPTNTPFPRYRSPLLQAKVEGETILMTSCQSRTSQANFHKNGAMPDFQRTKLNATTCRKTRWLSTVC